MNIPAIKMRHLHCLVVLAQEKSMVAAAEVLALSQPAVSKTISELEELVGRRLLQRHARGVELTAAGQAFVEYASASLRTLREGLDAAVAQPQSQQTSVVFGALPTISGTILPLAVETLRKAVPSLHLRIAGGTNTQLMARLRRGELDLVFGRLADPSDMLELKFEHLFSEPLVAVVRTQHPLRLRKKTSAQSLVDFPLILPAAGTEIRRTVDAFLVAQGVSMPACILDTLDSTFAAQYVRQSDAVWFLPSGLVAGLAPASLHKLNLDTAATLGPVGITTPINRELSSGSQQLIGAFRSAALVYRG